MSLEELARRRGYFFIANEAYGGVSGFYTYGPNGAAMKQNIEDIWRDRFIIEEGNVEIDSPTVTPKSVFEASGHLEVFDDMLIECPGCETSHRADHLVEAATDIDDAEAYTTGKIAQLIKERGISCPQCGTNLAGESVEEFNLMFKTEIGPGSDHTGFLRPETAQGMFVEFPRLKEYAREQLPFGVAQIGRGYRNEISPRNALLRAREFTMAELEFFVDPESDHPDLEEIKGVELPLYSAPAQNSDSRGIERYSVEETIENEIIAEEWIAYFLGMIHSWYDRIGVDMDRFRFRQHLSGELSHYASECWDAEAEVDGDWVELAGIASRTNYDLLKHDKHSDESYTVFKQYDEPKTVERASVDPDMEFLGPKFGSRAEKIADELETLANRDRSAFKGESVTVEIDGDTFSVPVDKTGFTVEQVKESGRHITPHVIEPAFGIGRAVYTVMAHQYMTDTVDGEERDVLRLPPSVAPNTAAIFPLMTKEGLPDIARDIEDDLNQ
ncbi:MAG: glycine--tRNA ligase, partial [Halobacteriaceae archaeon]